MPPMYELKIKKSNDPLVQEFIDKYILYTRGKSENNAPIRFSDKRFKDAKYKPKDKLYLLEKYDFFLLNNENTLENFGDLSDPIFDDYLINANLNKFEVYNVNMSETVFKHYYKKYNLHINNWINSPNLKYIPINDLIERFSEYGLKDNYIRRYAFNSITKYYKLGKKPKIKDEDLMALQLLMKLHS
jgi:hypothetical protein